MAVEEGLPLLELPQVALLHALPLPPHATLLPLAASSSALHTLVHSAPSLWTSLARLLLMPLLCQ
jgi:hypothetical protein